MSVRRFKRYPAYKDSGVAWLGEVPAHWEARKLKFVSTVIMGQSPPSEHYNTSGDGLPFLQGNADFGTEHPVPRVFCPVAPKTVKAGDHLISVRAPVGALNAADQAYGIGRGRGLQELEETRYWFELLRDGGILSWDHLAELDAEADELTAILVTLAKKRKAALR